MPETERQPIGLHLAWLLAVAIAGAFVTSLIIATGDVATYWPLYILPIVLAALAYHAPGAIVSVALSSAVVALLVYGAGYDASPVPTLVIGAAAFAVSGLVIGIQTQRYRRQRRQLERDATRDALTGAYCADYFEARVQEEVRRSARYSQDFTLALIRVVGFDDFQRLYGRVKADILLERLVQVLHLTVRSTDIVGRLDFSVFAVIMPSTPAPEAQAVAERVASAVEATEFEGDALEPVVHRGVQIVAVTYPSDAADADTLLGTARERLGPASPTSDDAPRGASGASAPSLGDAAS